MKIRRMELIGSLVIGSMLCKMLFLGSSAPPTWCCCWSAAKNSCCSRKLTRSPLLHAKRRRAAEQECTFVIYTLGFDLRRFGPNFQLLHRRGFFCVFIYSLARPTLSAKIYLRSYFKLGTVYSTRSKQSLINGDRSKLKDVQRQQLT